MPVVYPADFSTWAMVVAFSVSRSRSRMVCVTPFLNSCRPVISAERVGEQVGLTWKSVKRTASVVQPVEVRRLEDRVAVAGQVAVALIIGQHEDDVGPTCFQRRRERAAPRDR